MLANLWYDTIRDKPPAGSALETLLCMVYVHRLNAELRATRALVQATLPAGKEADPAIKAYQDYHDNLMPFLARAEDTEKEATIARLKEFVRGHAVIDKGTLLRQKMSDEHRRARARAQALRPQPTESAFDRKNVPQRMLARPQHPGDQRALSPRPSTRRQ